LGRKSHRLIQNKKFAALRRKTKFNVLLNFSLVAALGLVENSSVILVASMLISPLMVSPLHFTFSSFIFPICLEENETQSSGYVAHFSLNAAAV